MHECMQIVDKVHPHPRRLCGRLGETHHGGHSAGRCFVARVRPRRPLPGHDWIQEALPPWNQQHIREADGYAPAQQGRMAAPAPENPPKSVHRGHWAVKVVTPGSYTISLRRWPLEADHPITAALPPGADVPGATKAFRARPGAAIPATSATLRLNDKNLETKPVKPGDKEVTFTTRLTAGSHQLAPVFVDAIGNEIGAYYAVINKQP
jgi:hypothetical protein